MHGRSRMTIDPRITSLQGRRTWDFHRPGRHAFLSRRSTAPSPNRETSNIWALITFFPYILEKKFCSPYPLPVSPFEATRVGLGRELTREAETHAPSSLEELGRGFPFRSFPFSLSEPLGKSNCTNGLSHKVLCCLVSRYSHQPWDCCSLRCAEKTNPFSKSNLDFE